MNINKVLLPIALAGLCLPPTSPAEMYRCPAPNGTFEFTDKPCIDGEQRAGARWMNAQEQARRTGENEEAKANAHRDAKEHPPKLPSTYAQDRSHSTTDALSGLVVYYDFDEDATSEGTMHDRSGNNNHARSRGASIRAGRGRSGNAGVFAGGYLQLDTNPTANLKSRTVSLWFKAETPMNNYKLASAAWWRGGCDASGWNVGTHYFETWADDCGGSVWKDGTCTGSRVGREDVYKSNTWHHVVQAHDPEGRYQEYIDGKLVFDCRSTGKPIGRATHSDGRDSAMQVGAWEGGFIFRGSIDEFALFGRALKAGEVAQLADGTRPDRLGITTSSGGSDHRKVAASAERPTPEETIMKLEIHAPPDNDVSIVSDAATGRQIAEVIESQPWNDITFVVLRRDDDNWFEVSGSTTAGFSARYMADGEEFVSSRAPDSLAEMSLLMASYLEDEGKWKSAIGWE